MLICFQMLETEEEKFKFEKIYNEYRGLMFSIAYEMLRNDQDAEDAVYNALLSMIENKGKIPDIDDLRIKNTVVIITKNKAIDMYRRKKKIQWEELDDNIVCCPINEHEISPLENALANLPCHQRELLLLRYYAGYSTHEISALYGEEYGTIRKRIYRAKCLLETLYREEIDE